MDSSGKLTNRDATEMKPKKKNGQKRATWLLFLHTPSNLRNLDFSHANKHTKEKTLLLTGDMKIDFYQRKPRLLLRKKGVLWHGPRWRMSNIRE